MAQLIDMAEAKTRRAWPQYFVLSLFLGITLIQEAGSIGFLARALLHPTEVAAEPFQLLGGTNQIAKGKFAGQTILAINGKPFRSVNEFLALVQASKPGNTVRVTLSDLSGAAHEEMVPIPGHVYNSTSDVLVAVALNIVIPAVALSLGFGVAFIRPRDSNAWLLLFLMRSFSDVVAQTGYFPPFPALNQAWDFFWANSWSTWMLLFGIAFPRRLPLDRTRPWLKYALVIPMLFIALAQDALTVTWLENVLTALRFRRLLVAGYFTGMVMNMVGVSFFFYSLSWKMRRETSLDSRRRLRILVTGAYVALLPAGFATLRSLALGTSLFAGIPAPVVVYILLSLGMFPAVLAYVIVVERAMDLSIVIRQGVKYGLARTGLWVVRIVIGVTLAIFVRQEFSRKEGANPYKIMGPILGLVLVRRRYANSVSDWVDRQFFREAYNAEKVLADLAGEVSRAVETGPLIETVASRIADTLHVADIVVLLREGAALGTVYSTRPGEPMSLARNSRIVRRLRETGAAQVIDFDNPGEWLHTLDAEELQTLDYMRTQLLLALPGKEDLAGVMSLGAKRSGESWSSTDIKLLEAIAGQMGLAVENSRLLASLAAEAGHRERQNRELEIAREVQERLFPQKFPPLPGLDCAGYCRPARGVGGDYYDFIQLDGRLGIAIGDVSGKGIGAALLMASLQASLRGQTMAGVRDLSALMLHVNRLVYDASTSNRYATFFYGEYEYSSGVLTFVNGGHNAPVILRGPEVLRLEAGGPVVGLLPGAAYVQDSIQLKPGDIFIGYTDGISEAPNQQEEEWEEERFLAAARQCAGLEAQQMIQSVFRAADAFTGSAEQFDDMTLVIVKIAVH